MRPFIEKQPEHRIQTYKELLKATGMISKINSDDEVPLLYFKTAELIFCRAFEADNISKSDISADAKKGNVGIGVKTFKENNGKNFEKIAEFNKSRSSYKKYEKKPENLIRRIGELRNERIRATKEIIGVEKIFYHCVTRKARQFLIFEEEMDCIDIKKIKVKHNNKYENVIDFDDGLSEYKFNITKSTLFKKFITKNPIEIEMQVLEQPFEKLLSFYQDNKDLLKRSQGKPSVILPLFSVQGGKNVPKKSGLNHGFADDRKRKRNNKEAYIPIPAWIHKKFPNFFPDKDVSFKLELPNGNILNAKACQALRKALMSNPNTDLGIWLINDVLNIEEGKPATLEILEEIGIDSVEVTRQSSGRYKIDFKDIGSYENFLKENH